MTGQQLTRRLADAEETRRFGAALGRLLRAGDLVLLVGGLGAGKTTLTQGLAEGLGVRGPIISPTFVISRVHPSEVGGPALVHVDAYRLDGAAELDDLDLDDSVESSVTVVEWGQGLVEQLTEARLEVVLRHPEEVAEPPVAGRAVPDPGALPDYRVATLRTVGQRWSESEVVQALAEVTSAAP
ncbi:tRNA (adenosine(37)-N6)-threonylcarbamoyltransferase complex ATPase subunit type 1 TsaE [Ornithinicoccus hortensis]|uniref:tRNA threonylcarbamoyladenosine biosynthesis protein TsaE n=1 Tax=Ornithinicoccus hortensis TaxID=82346 RepID=A0A542YVA6_9MICO|nr:tRNA (adenosine(37)-N6)-threonylcarbamoyltransferase complex ATPase subunit type 1 TsaE [Ornithinicoccus hortensis]TQL52017.1 tRNA threonylcarbamoyladenosine biosynthesis protein TsaE [Ornithinicoccus hortensis]